MPPRPGSSLRALLGLARKGEGLPATHAHTTVCGMVWAGGLAVPAGDATRCKGSNKRVPCTSYHTQRTAHSGRLWSITQHALDAPLRSPTITGGTRPHGRARMQRTHLSTRPGRQAAWPNWQSNSTRDRSAVGCASGFLAASRCVAPPASRQPRSGYAYTLTTSALLWNQRPPLVGTGSSIMKVGPACRGWAAGKEERRRRNRCARAGRA